jgi:small subunit ribosomal protein S16
VAVVLRLRKMGQKKKPMFRIVAADKKYQRDGRFLETLGHYNPIFPGGAQSSLKKERVEYWLSVGAQPTETVWSLLKKEGIKKPVRSSKKAPKAEN